MRTACRKSSSATRRLLFRRSWTAPSPGAPSIITRHGKPEAVIISFEEWERLSRVPSFGRLLMAAPLEPGDLPERDGSGTRPADF